MGMVGVRDVFVVAPAASFHHQHHHQYHDQMLADPSTAAVNNAAAAAAVSNSNATALGVGVIPLLAATPCLVEENEAAAHSRKVHHLWQSHHQMQQGEVSFFKKNAQMEENSNSGANVGGGGGGGGGGNVLGGGSGVGAMGMGGAGMTCQDCGNQAKKDCSHRRCRTCCKSRGFDCATHVKSTWVPAQRRRERQLAATAAGGSAGSTSSAKKPRLISSQTTTTASHTSTSNTTPPRSFDTGSSHQDASFREGLPGQVRAPAVFRCVRVTSIDDGEDEYAYQAVVNIGGHVFKGFLYDHGVEGRDGLPNISDLHLGGPSARNGASTSSFPALDAPDVYTATTSGGLLGGTNYGNPLN